MLVLLHCVLGLGKVGVDNLPGPSIRSMVRPYGPCLELHVILKKETVTDPDIPDLSLDAVTEWDFTFSFWRGLSVFYL